jgi:hypothetical protein
MLKSWVNFCSRDFFFHKKVDAVLRLHAKKKKLLMTFSMTYIHFSNYAMDVCEEGCVQHVGCVRIEVPTMVTMKNAVVWDVMPCGSCKNRWFGGMYRLHHQGEKYQ